MIIGYTAGVYDLLHEGHCRLLQESKKLCDKLVVGVVSDQGASKYKRLPIDPETRRLARIQALGCVDLAIIQQESDPTRELEVIRPHIFTHGSDWDRLKFGHETLERLGIKYITLPYTEGVSTTKIIWHLDSR
jgi:rfaE bifunctional protein nucleotidyltransferase chain/domain